ncbi:MAG: polyprenyl synthetase family protein [Bacteroidales bacterium]|nr:polyprenyl synthetase family protein [Bacteroidales bacterium]
MYTIEELQKKIDISISGIPFSGHPAELYDPISYILALGGKRMRPVLTLLTCDMFGGDVDKAIAPAIGIEIFHNFTLLHDDIMDNAPIRRGKPSVHAKWNENIAILSGDTMFAVACKYIAKSPKKHLKNILDIFTQTAIEVCEGQQFDMNFEILENVSIDDYINMIRLKTAVLPAAAMKIGALIGDAPDEETENIYRFGENIGIAFQLMDDFLDAFGNEKVFGKRTGGDIAVNKKTFLYLKSFETAKGNMLEKLQYYYDPRYSDMEEKVREIIDIYKALEIDKITKFEIDKYYSKATTCLQKIPIPETNKSNLLEYAGKLMKRIV